MFFRKQYTLHDLGLAQGDVLELSESAPFAMRLTIRRPAADEQTKLKPGQCEAVIQTEEAISEKVRGYLEEFEKPHPSIIEIGRKVGGRLYDYLVRTASILRWRTGVSTPPNPIYNAGFLLWSDDGVQWKGVPATLGIEVEIIQQPQPMSNAIRDSIVDLVTAGNDEPVAHELLQEARAQRRNFTRSALLIAVTAAEVGFKEFVGDLVPDAKWLAFNAPTPPLVTMLIELLPLLPVRLRIKESPPFVPKAMTDILKKAVLLRNKAAHAGGSVEREALGEILTTVQDLLYLLDFYRGREWAWDRIASKTRDLIDEHISQCSAK